MNFGYESAIIAPLYRLGWTYPFHDLRCDPYNLLIVTGDFGQMIVRHASFLACDAPAVMLVKFFAQYLLGKLFVLPWIGRCAA